MHCLLMDLILATVTRCYKAAIFSFVLRGELHRGFVENGCCSWLMLFALNGVGYHVGELTIITVNCWKRGALKSSSVSSQSISTVRVGLARPVSYPQWQIAHPPEHFESNSPVSPPPSQSGLLSYQCFCRSGSRFWQNQKSREGLQRVLSLKLGLGLLMWSYQ